MVGNSNDDAYNKLMNEPLFGGEALNDIIDKIEWLEGLSYFKNKTDSL